MKKTILLLMIIILSTSVYAEWKKTGSDKELSYIQDNDRTIIDENYTVSTFNSDEISLVEPLVADLDNDSFNEIIIFDSSEIKLYTGTAYIYESSYVNSSITITGNAEVIDWDDDGILELIFVSNTIGSNHSLMVFTYNGTWTLEKEIENVTGGNGINCHELYNNKIECCYVGFDGEFYCYDSTNNYNTTPKSSLNGNDCLGGSIPIYINYNEDDYEDVYFIYDITCTELILLRNNGDGTFDNIYNITTTAGINQISKANLDGGVKELIVTDSTYCGKVGTTCEPFSHLRIHNILDGSENCKIEPYKAKGYAESPYLTGLHTCYGQEGALNCDYNNDGFNDVYVLGVYYPRYLGYQNTTLMVYDDNCDLLWEKQILGLRISTLEDIEDSSTTLYSKAVWGNFDLDSQYELWVWNTIVDKDGTEIFSLKDTEIYQEEFDSPYNFLIFADVNNDNINELIYQFNDDIINITAFHYDNQKPVIEQVSWDTGTPVCIDTTINYIINFADMENDYSRIAIDCYGNNSFNNGTFYNQNAQHFCFYDVLGNFNTILYLQDIVHPNDFTVYYSHTVDVTASDYCYSSGSGGSESNVSDTGVIGGMDDWASQIPSFMDDIGFKSTASRVFFVIVIIIAVILELNKYHKSAFISVLVAIMILIVATYFGLIPVWVTFLIFVFAVLLVFMFLTREKGE